MADWRGSIRRSIRDVPAAIARPVMPAMRTRMLRTGMQGRIDGQRRDGVRARRTGCGRGRSSARPARSRRRSARSARTSLRSKSQARSRPWSKPRRSVSSARRLGELRLDRGEQRRHPLPRPRRDQRRPAACAPRPARSASACAGVAARRSCSRPRSSGLRRPRRRRARRGSRARSRPGSRSRGCAMSRTCRIRSASSTSSSVARKAATSWCGRSEMKPTVSDRIDPPPAGQLDRAHRRVERGEEHVLRQRPPAPVSRLNSVDLPALV